MARTQPLPGVPDMKAFDAAIDEVVPDPEEELAKTPYSTSLGLAMAEDAKAVSRGELTGAEFWERHDSAAAEEFGDDYRETPNPDIGGDAGTLDVETAGDLQCAVGDPQALQMEEDGDEDTPRWGMVIDLQKCVGCESCTVACKAENRTPPEVTYNVVMEVEEGEYPNTRRTNLPRPCLQCENPPCVQVCPVSATYKMKNGIVNIDYERCIGCRYCLIACPYGARFSDFGGDYDDEVTEYGEVTAPEYGVDQGRREGKKSPIGNARKCNYCYHRLERGEEPACVETCLGDARYFGDLDDPDSEVANHASKTRAFRLKEEEGTEPNMYYLR